MQVCLTYVSERWNQILQTFLTPLWVHYLKNTGWGGGYWNRFCTFIQMHSIPEAKQAQVFLTNQTSVLYKLISSYPSQLSPSKEVNQLMLKEIQVYMKEQFAPTIFVVRERYKFWSDMNRSLIHPPASPKRSALQHFQRV